MKLPRISIVIPSYNKGKYIEETLKSIIAQKYSNLEVIIQDGGSSDESLKIIKRYAAKHAFIKWESKKDRGQTDAIKIGFLKASGDLYTFINADDVYLPGAFKAIGKCYQKHPKQLWMAGWGITVDEEGKEIASFADSYKKWLLKQNNYNNLLIVNYLMQASVFLSKDAYHKFGPFTGVGKIVMEYNTWLKIGKKTMPKIINKPLSAFRLSKENFSMGNLKEIMKADDRIVSQYTDDPIILFLHWLHNAIRVIIAYVLKNA
jgi:glycosyltransferase involved in cell wall biosynthesis